MIDRSPIIEIDSVVLRAMGSLRPERLTALIEAEVARALAGTAWPAAANVPSDAGVAAEVARAVVRSIHGGAADV